MPCNVICNASLLNLDPAAGLRLEFRSVAQQYLVEGASLVLPDSSAFVVLSSAGTGSIDLTAAQYQVFPSNVTTGEGFAPFFITVPSGTGTAYLHLIRNLPPPASLDAAQQAVLDAQIAASAAQSAADLAVSQDGVSYSTKAIAIAAIIPTSRTEIVVRRYDIDSPYALARYRATNLTEFNTYPARLRFIDAGGRYWVIAESTVETAMAGARCANTNDTAAIDACWAFKNLGDTGFDWRASPGVSIYDGVATQSTVNWTTGGHVSGYGSGKSVIKGSVGHRYFANTGNIGIGDAAYGTKDRKISGITFEGDWGGLAHTDNSLKNERLNEASLLKIQGSRNLVLGDVELIHSRWIGGIFQNTVCLTVLGGHTAWNARAGINAQGLRHYTVDGIKCGPGDDDAMNLGHTVDSGEPFAVSGRISNVTLFDNNGIKLIAPRNLIISNVHGKLMKSDFIAATPGYAAVADVSIHDCSVSDLLKSSAVTGLTVRQNATCIRIGARAPSGTFGSEMISNGNFNNTSGWGLSGNLATGDVPTVSGQPHLIKTTGGVGVLTRAMTFTAETVYNLRMKLRSTIADAQVGDPLGGAVNISITGGDDPVVLGTFLEEDREVDLYFTARDGHTTLRLDFSASAACFVDDVSMRPVVDEIIPGESDGTTGITPRLPAYVNNSTSSAVAPGADVAFNGVRCVVTKAPVDLFSEYGERWPGSLEAGQFTKNGWVNSPITAEALGSSRGIVVEGIRSGLVIDGCNMSGIAFPYTIDPIGGDLHSGSITGGVVTGFVRAITELSRDTTALVVDGVQFDGDPECSSALRGTGGRWTGFGGKPGVYLSTGKGGTLQNCSIRNVPQVYVGATLPAGFAEHNNTLFGDFVAIGDHADNLGIRRVPGTERGYHHELIHSDPRSATYGQLKQAVLRSSAAAPTTGWYPAGHFVRAIGPTVTDGRVITGWYRATTGTTHAAADWITRYDWVLRIGQDFAREFTTRAQAVTAIAAGWVPPAGRVFWAAGVPYRGQTSATDIADMAGCVPNDLWTPLHFGALGDGTTDDGVALNTAWARYKAHIESVAQSLGSADLSGMGLRYRSTIPVIWNDTTGWGWSVRDLTILSEATGENALELIGSRGGHLTNVTVWGHATNMPRIGIVAARSVTSQQDQFADQTHWEMIRTRGHFSLTAVYLNGQESTNYPSCEFWNSQFDAHCGVIAGTDVYPINSDVTTPVTGATSHINCNYTRAEFRHLPVLVSAVTALTRTNPCVLTLNAANFTVGQTIVLAPANEVNGGYPQSYLGTVTAVSGLTCTVDIDASAWSVYDGSGLVLYKAQTVSTLLLARLNGHRFTSCYLVNYGSHVVEFQWPDGSPSRNIDFDDACVEAYGIKSYFRFTVGSSAVRQLLGFKYSGYQGRAQQSFLSTDASGAGGIQIQDLTFKMVSVEGFGVGPIAPFVDTPSKYTIYNAHVTLPDPSMADFEDFGIFTGKAHFITGALTREWGTRLFATNSLDLRSPSGSITVGFGDLAGDTGFIRFAPSTSIFSFSHDGTTANWGLSSGGFYPTTDNTGVLGIASTNRWAAVNALIGNYTTLNVGNIVTTGAIDGAGGFRFQGATHTEFAGRLLRGALENDQLSLVNKGTGGIALNATGVAAISLITNGAERWRVNSSGVLSPATNLGANFGALTLRASEMFGLVLNLGANSTDFITITPGFGSPEGVLTANPGSLYLNRAGGVGTTVYSKNSGTGNTGWAGLI